MDFEYLEHTADAKFRAYGSTLEGAFANAARAMFNIMVDIKSVRHSKKRNIELSAKRRESLLYDFLEELLFLFETEGFIPSMFEDMKIEELKKESHEAIAYTLVCTVSGDNLKGYELNGDVKSITYNDMDISQRAEGVVLTVVVDI